tara:strand:+ start:162 stop:341 length:180 start_codon:yes stop_codon:yes gene_type:complete
MEAGDLIRKDSGHDAGKIGVLLEVLNKDNGGHLICSVYSEGRVRSWAGKLCSIVIKNTK